MSTRNVGDKCSYRQRGLSLIELVMFIVIVSTGIVGILSVMNLTTSRSADPMVRKQAIAIAESMLEEIELQAFTYCDPDDANALNATSAGACATTAQGTTATAGETRYGPSFFDNVADYNNFTMNPIRDINNTVLPELANYSLTTPIAITQAGTALGLANNADALRIDVTVNYGADSVTLTGYRFRYAPNAL
jgi:MSHA pilin protein MshD